MSFRTRLTTFFVVIVVVPMIAFGVLVFRLIGQSEDGKADARANGLATAAASIYQQDSAAAKADAATLAKSVASLHGAALKTRVSFLRAQSGLVRVTAWKGSTRVVDVGAHNAVAPGSATITGRHNPGITSVTASEVTAPAYVRELLAPGVAVVVRQAGRTLTSTLALPAGKSLPRRGTISVHGSGYRGVTQTFRGFGGAPVEVTVLSNVAATATSAGSTRVLAAALIAGFLLLAAGFAVLASRGLHGQLGRFLEAARRIGGGDFSSRVPVDGRDEFAALGAEFNQMSGQLAQRIDELGQERGRLREAIRRIGETFAAGLDRPALLELALRTAVDAVQADWGRLSTRLTAGEPLSESARVGSLSGVEDRLLEAERTALAKRGTGEKTSDDLSIVSVALGPFESGGSAHGVVTVGRRGDPFTDDDLEVLRSLAAQATVALANVELHVQTQHQAVTDELTGLANHGHFQDLLSLEIEQVRRYHHPVGLIMLDLDDFKSINDTYGHQQGDVVLEHVARALRDTAREVDVPARYGGEEMAVILPHTDLEGSYAIAERLRVAIEALQIPFQNGEGPLRVTASLGVSTSTDGDKDALIGAADAALYVAKRQGKNRTIRAQAQTANVVGAE